MGNLIDLVHRRLILNSHCTVRSFTIALIGVFVVQSLALGGNPLPPSPPPCVADGVCTPNRDSWGYNATRWRTWPGEVPPAAPTPVDEELPDEDRPLRRFERPEPQREDLRGPSRPVPAIRGGVTEPGMPVDPAIDVEQGLPFGDPFGVEQPGQPFGEPEARPAVDDLFPDLNQQGQAQPLPNTTDDVPPTLPHGLQQALKSRISINTRQPAAAVSHSTMQPEVAKRPSVSIAAHATSPMQARDAVTESVNVQASWNQTGATSIRLVNPAAANVVHGEDTEEGLQQAFYIEASDQD